MKGLLLLISLWLWGCCDDTTLVIYGMGSSADDHTLRVSIWVGQKLVRAPPKAHVEALAFSLQRRVPAGQAIDILVEEVDASGLVLKEARQQVTAPDQDCWVEAQMNMAQPLVQTMTAVDLYAVWGLGDEVWVAGDQSTILHFDGRGWVKDMEACRDIHLRGVWGSQADLVKAVGDNAILAKDAGGVWRCMAERPAGVFYQAIAGGGGLVYVAGSRVDPQRPDLSPVLTRFPDVRNPILSEISLTGKFGLKALSVLGSNYWALGDLGDLLKNSVAIMPGLNPVGYALWNDGAALWAAAGMDVLKLTDNGQTRISLKPPNPPFNQPLVIRGLWGQGPEDLWAVGLTGYIARYRTGQWQMLPQEKSANLYAIWGDANSVWIVGTRGTVLHYYLQP